ncbi:cell division protein SepF [Methanobrevibacter sp.]|uniref:cell division protein SepF n=1 Tax=Methanobrevibacter sp. TaxID=66852 RepID=UPI0025F20F26|nr:cell division protein SepF [Methanobrevibacter sp.]MEE0025406.1 cell division protein SepF [Methanobrevibacter sp.]
MNFMDTIKKSLGFEVDEDFRHQNRAANSNNGFSNFTKPRQNPNFRNNPRPRPDFDDVEPIIPEQSFYEIVLIRPKTIDDINYVVDQVLEEKNPVLLDLSFLESESPANFKLAGEKIKQMRTRYGAQALLLSRSSEKNLIILSPKKVRLVKKN